LIDDSVTPGEHVSVAIDPSGLATVLIPGYVPQFVRGGIYAATGRRQRFGPPEVVASFPACTMNATSDAAGNTYVVWATSPTVCRNRASRPPSPAIPAGRRRRSTGAVERWRGASVEAPLRSY
jgi:hypothetical protein